MLKAFAFTCLVVLCSNLLQAQQTYTEHKVRWMENIHTIARKYKVDAQAILDYNQISKEDVKRGRVLLIPLTPSPKEETPSEELFQEPDEITPGPFNPHDCAQYQPYIGITHRVSLILPLKLQEIPASAYFMDFYHGVLLAAQDIKEQGMGLRLQVYDTETTPASVLAHSPELRQEELIIGPVFANDVFTLLQNTSGEQAILVSPLDPGTEAAISGYPRFFQVTPSPASQQRNLLQYIKPFEGKVWLMYETDASLADAEWLRITRECLEQMGIPYTEFSHKVEKDVDISATLRELLALHTHNQVIVSSSNEGFVSYLLSKLHLVHNLWGSPVTLFGDARWPSFEDNIDLDYFHNMNLHLSLPYYVDYQREDLKQFLARYRGLYHTDPSPYAFQGYDVARYFLHALYTKGPSFEHCLSDVGKDSQPLQSPMYFQRSGEGQGFINTQTRVIQYLPDYTIKILEHP
jgi:ABC-type branched-chain amino acid transport systems, periplasmic component